jgi:hypothetical protein
MLYITNITSALTRFERFDLTNIHKFSNYTCVLPSKISHAKDRVDRPMIEQLNVQGKLDTRGGLCCVWH